MAQRYQLFNTDKLLPLAQRYQVTFGNLDRVETELRGRFYNMDRAARALVLAAACGEPLLFVGPPGTGKSRFIRDFCDLVGLKAHSKDNQAGGPNAKEVDYFEYLLTPFTEPGELFGYYNIAAAQKGQLVRDTQGMMQTAKVVYLDEVFNGSSAILNSLLSFIQERRFHDRGQWQEVPMQCLFGATNEIPQQNELRAVYDRFTFRCWIDNITEYAVPNLAGPLGDLLGKAWVETYAKAPENGQIAARVVRPRISYPGLLDDLKRFRADLQDLVYSGLALEGGQAFLARLATDVSHATRANLGSMSNRRLVRLLHAMLVHRVYRACALAQGSATKTALRAGDLSLSDEDLQIFAYFLDRRDRKQEQPLGLEAGL